MVPVANERKIVDWNHYQQQALTTAIFPLDRSLEYTVLGLGSESGELGEKYLDGKISPFGVTVEAVLSEAGDLCWYAAAVADAADLRFADIEALLIEGEILRHTNEPDVGYSRGFTILRIQKHVSEIQGVVKKAIRDNKGYVETHHYSRIESHLVLMMFHLKNLVEAYGSTLDAVMNKNLNKLADRSKRGVLAGSGDNR